MQKGVISTTGTFRVRRVHVHEPGAMPVGEMTPLSLVPERLPGACGALCAMPLVPAPSVGCPRATHAATALQRSKAMPSARTVL